MPRLCEVYPGICLTNEEKARKTLSEGKKNLSHCIVYILPKHPQNTHITKLSHTHTHTLQNNIKQRKDTNCRNNFSNLKSYIKIFVNFVD